MSEPAESATLKSGLGRKSPRQCQQLQHPPGALDDSGNIVCRKQVVARRGAFVDPPGEHNGRGARRSPRSCFGSQVSPNHMKPLQGVVPDESGRDFTWAVAFHAPTGSSARVSRQIRAIVARSLLSAVPAECGRIWAGTAMQSVNGAGFSREAGRTTSWDQCRGPWPSP